MIHKKYNVSNIVAAFMAGFIMMSSSIMAMDEFMHEVMGEYSCGKYENNDKDNYYGKYDLEPNDNNKSDNIVEDNDDEIVDITTKSCNEQNSLIGLSDDDKDYYGNDNNNDIYQFLNNANLENNQQESYLKYDDYIRYIENRGGIVLSQIKCFNPHNDDFNYNNDNSDDDEVMYEIGGGFSLEEEEKDSGDEKPSVDDIFNVVVKIKTEENIKQCPFCEYPSNREKVIYPSVMINHLLSHLGKQDRAKYCMVSPIKATITKPSSEALDKIDNLIKEKNVQQKTKDGRNKIENLQPIGKIIGTVYEIEQKTRTQCPFCDYKVTNRRFDNLKRHVLGHTKDDDKILYLQKDLKANFSINEKEGKKLYQEYVNKMNNN